jgi:hypothetical protein
MRRLILTTLIVGGLFALLAAVQGPGAQAARPANLAFAQACAGDKVNVTVVWTSDPSARELWIDVSKNNDGFATGVQSAGPLASRTTSHVWRGLDQHTIYYWRVNQLLPSGAWEPSLTHRSITGCGNTAAKPGTNIEIIGFADKNESNESALTRVNGRLRSCNPERIYAHVRVGASAGNRGDSEIVDGTMLWFAGTTQIARIVEGIDIDAPSNTRVYSYRKSGGHSPGPYSFELWTGGDGTWRMTARGQFTLDC